jgi:uncharacterized membrane protein
MMTWIYSAIVAYLLLLTVWDLYREEKRWNQVTCALVLIPLLLRLVGIK